MPGVRIRPGSVPLLRKVDLPQVQGGLPNPQAHAVIDQGEEFELARFGKPDEAGNDGGDERAAIDAEYRTLLAETKSILASGAPRSGFL